MARGVHSGAQMNPLLGRSIGGLSQPVVPVSIDSSLQLAAERMRDLGLPALPVSDSGRIIGALIERDLTQALSTGFEETAAVSSIPLTQLPMLFAGASGAEALRVFEEHRAPCVIVVDQQMSLVGMLTPSRLFPHVPRGIRPPLVGGMATPVGVYLTNGAQGGGVGNPALLMTGVFLAVIHFVAGQLSLVAGIGMDRLGLPPMWTEGLIGVFSVFLFLAAIRLTPLAGYHAAEHMVVHTIERGEQLHPDIVARMPRVHPRCGTNLAAGMALFFGISLAPWPIDQGLQVFVALIVTIFFWRSFGSFLQFYFTTRPPNRKQIDAGIKAGRELLDKYEKNPVVAPGGLSRLIASGMPWILLGYMVVAYGLEALAQLLNLGPLPRV